MLIRLHSLGFSCVQVSHKNLRAGGRESIEQMIETRGREFLTSDGAIDKVAAAETTACEYPTFWWSFVMAHTDLFPLRCM